jgi:hypothetical protein
MQLFEIDAALGGILEHLGWRRNGGRPCRQHEALARRTNGPDPCRGPAFPSPAMKTAFLRRRSGFSGQVVLRLEAPIELRPWLKSLTSQR